MEISDDFFEWLQSYDAEVKAEPSSVGRLCLSAETIRKLQSGQIFPRILMRLLKLEGSAFTLGDLEFISSETLKVDNWNAVLCAAESIGMRLETEAKELILAGQSDVLLELLEALYSKELEWRTSSPAAKKGRRPKQAPDGALFIESIDVSRPIGEAESCLEFLLIAFCTHFHLKQKQAAGLLTEGNRYLSVLLSKGLKGDFQPLLSMYESIRDNMPQLADCILRESKNGSLTLVASALRPGLQSRSDDIVQETALFFRDLSKCLNEQNSSLWQWFIGPLGAMDASVSALKRGPARTVKTVTEMLFEVSRGRLEEMLLVRLKDQLADLQDFLGVVAEMVRYIAEIEEGTDTLVSTGILSSLLEMCLREGDGGQSPASVLFRIFSL